jgi:cytochrome P450
VETPATLNVPADPVAAVTHPDPYAYYARLVGERPFYRDAALGTWVASSARAVNAVLSNPACRVRPAAEPVPGAIAGSPAGAIFGRMVRMNDGAVHPPLKKAVAATFDALDTARVARESERWAASLARELRPWIAPANLVEFAFGLSAHVIGSLLGAPEESVPAIARHAEHLARCFAPACPPEAVERGKLAAAQLLEQFLPNCKNRSLVDEDTLLAELMKQAQCVGCNDPEVIAANGIGFLFQAYESVGGLIVTSLLTLARLPEVRELVARTPALLGIVVDEVLRYDSPVQNTRRFVAETTAIEGQELRPGDVVLVVLAAANRDPAANPDPHRFDLTRPERYLFSLGVGPHACPGRRLTTAIATAAVARLLECGGIPEHLDLRPTYRPSVNTRIPLLDWPTSAAQTHRGGTR